MNNRSFEDDGISGYQFNVSDSLLSAILDILTDWRAAEILEREALLESQKRQTAIAMAQKCVPQLKGKLRQEFPPWFTLAYVAGYARKCEITGKGKVRHVRILVRNGRGWSWEIWSPSSLSLKDLQGLYQEQQDAFIKVKKTLESKWESTRSAEIHLTPNSKKTILERCCPALLRISGDSYETAKAAAPIILTLTLTGAISLPIQPLIIAGVTLLIARMILAGVCADLDVAEKK